MIDHKLAKAWVEQHRMWFYIISFLSFWLALVVQPFIQSFLADKVPANILGVSIIFAMWIFATVIFPIIGSMAVIHFIIKNKTN